MKKSIAILFLSIYLLSVAGAGELLKVTALIEHFQETKESDLSLSFVDFLVMHYITDDGNDTDDDQDSQLPFKSNNVTQANNNALFLLNKAEEYNWPLIGTLQAHFPNYAGPSIDADYYGSVWRPPQFS